MSNQEIIRKADWALGDLNANNGLLNPEQANTFIRKLLVQPTLLQRVRRVIMNAPKRKVNKIQFASRILRAGSNNQTGAMYEKYELDDSNTGGVNKTRAEPTTEQIELNSNEVIAEVRLPYEVIEDNIERGNIGAGMAGTGRPSGGIVDTIMTLIAERVAIDLEELAIMGDTALSSTDNYLALTDGYLKRFSDNIVDFSNVSVSRSLLTNGMKTMPTQYRRDRKRLMHFVSTETEIDYRETIARRETSAGDSQTSSLAPVYAAGSPLAPIGLMPETDGFLTHPLNLLFGIQRQIHVESEKNIQRREYAIVVTARVDFQVEESLAGVRYRNIGSA